MTSHQPTAYDLQHDDPAEQFDQLEDEIRNDPEAGRAYQDAMHRAAVLAAGPAIRKSAGLSQEAVAKAMGTAQSAISALEAGRVEPQLSTLQRYARAVGRRLHVEFLDESEPPVPGTGEGNIPGALWEHLENTALSPLLTALITETDTGRRTLTALADTVPLPPRIVQPILTSLQQNGWATSVGHGEDAVYSLIDQAAMVIGVAIQRDHVTGVLTDLTFKVHYNITQQLRDTSPQAVMEAVSKVIDTVYRAQTERRVLGIGVTLAGVVDSNHGTVWFAPDLEFPGQGLWHGVDLEHELQRHVQQELGYNELLVAVENDANALAIKEYLGRGDHSTEVVLLSGAGIGVGYVAEGHPIHGAHSAAGEGGHVIVDPDGPDCRAGLPHQGCLETMASAQGVLRKLELKADTPSELESGLAESSRRIAKGDKQATEAFNDAGIALGRFVATTIRLLDSSRVVLYASPLLAKRGPGHETAKVFQAGVQAGLDESSASRRELVEPPRLEWHAYTDSTAAASAAAVATRHFLMHPARWAPAMMAETAPR